MEQVHYYQALTKVLANLVQVPSLAFLGKAQCLQKSESQQTINQNVMVSNETHTHAKPAI